MSLGTLVKQFKSLTLAEQQKFRRAVANTATPKANRDATLPRRQVHWPDVSVRAASVTGGRVLPNLVLLEREESAS